MRDTIRAWVLLLPAACAPGGCAPEGERSDTASPLVTIEGYRPATVERLHAAGWRTDLALHTVPLERIQVAPLLGGGFQPIRDPGRAAAASVELDPAEPVLVLRGADQVHAWPLVHLLRRELVLDEVDGVPLAVTYCSLCDGARILDRRLEGAVLDLAVSGLLLDGSSLLFDAQTHSLWSQRDGSCIAGAHSGRRLAALPAFVVSFASLQEAHPAALVRMAAGDGAHDPSLTLLSSEDIARGTPPSWMRAACVDPLARMLVLEGGSPHELDGRGAVHLADVVLLADPVAAAVHRTAAGACGPPLGSAAAFEPTVDGLALTFESDEHGIRDRETGSRWNPLGEAISGPLAGRHLEPALHRTSFRFAAPEPEG